MLIEGPALWWLAAAHALATCIMVGLIWFVQIVHYPLFARVGRDAFAAYEAEHQRRTTLVVAPTMFVEVGTAALLLFALPTNVTAWIGAVLLAVVWASTFFVQVPLHTRLSQAWDDRLGRALVRTNWVRTLAWSARGVCAFVMLRSIAGS